MIQANELRIGNYTDYGKVIDISKDRVILERSEITGLIESYPLSEINPIPLTPEILLACGFEKNGFRQFEITLPKNIISVSSKLFFSGDYLYLRQPNDEKPANDSIITIWNKDLMKKFYLHSLQNLYFSLTGTELIYQPK